MFLRQVDRFLQSGAFSEAKENLDLDLNAPPDPNCTNPNWTLDCCCGDEEVIFISLMCGYILANFFLWNSLLLKPMKLIAVFVHEFSHATACWITGGKVSSIEVINNEGGVTKYEGGKRCIIIPAGYLGCAFWGMLLVVLSGERLASLISACIFIFSLVISIFFSPNRMMKWMCVGFIVLTVAFIVMDRLLFHPLLQFLTLFYGTFIGCFSIYDIYDDLNTRTVERSDAHACHDLVPCCIPRYVGLQFVVVALAFQTVGLYLALVWMTST